MNLRNALLALGVSSLFALPAAAQTAATTEAAAAVTAGPMLLRKANHMLELEFSYEGAMDTTCDLSNDPFVLELFHLDDLGMFRHALDEGIFDRDAQAAGTGEEGVGVILAHPLAAGEGFGRRLVEADRLQGQRNSQAETDQQDGKLEFKR